MAEIQLNTQLVQTLIAINQLQVKAFNAPTRASLSFIIVNDTHQVFKYDQAILWEISDHTPSEIAISGQHTLNKETEVYQKSRSLLSHLKDPSKPQELTEDSFSKDSHLLKEIFFQSGTLIYWLPIKQQGAQQVALWLEIWPQPNIKERDPKKELQFLSTTLIPAYAAAWAKFDKTPFLSPLRKKKTWYYLTPLLLILLFGIRIPLRVAAPCEVVPQKPFVMSAPLDGVIAEVIVRPGQKVREGDTLFMYDKRVPLEQLKEASKQVEISQAEVERSATVGLSDPKSLAELEVLKLKLEKDQVALELAQSQADRLDVKAPDQGIVMIEDPEEWSGKPVKVGEKVLTLSDPDSTKVKIWIPEGDNVIIDPQRDINVILNVAPERELHAKLDFIAFESHIGEGDVPAFLAEALWVTPPKDIKLGLKGTAILYGDRVSLFYFIVRKPWATLRRLTGF